MTLRTKLRLTWTLVGLLAVTTIGIGAGLMAWPLPSVATTSAQPQSSVAIETDDPKPHAPLSTSAVLWEKDLLRPLFDTATVTAKTAPPPKPDVHLTGTIIEGEFSYAILQDKTGQTKMLTVGQTLEGLKILAITTDSATVRFAGTEHILKVEKEGQTP